MNKSALTIILALKGRDLFTVRFLWHANRQQVPYKFIVVDAEPHPSVKKAIENKAFPNLNITYKICPPDHTFNDYYKKILSAAELVDTPYVMQVDNDDFLTPSGIELCLKWLDINKDYVACSGLVKPMGFDNVSDIVIGDAFNFSGKHYDVYNINHTLPLRRVIDGKVGETSYYYSIIRAEAFLHISQTIVAISPTYLLFYEIFFELSLLSLGKVKIDDTFCTYIRQMRTSMTGYYRSLNHLLESDIGSDSRKMQDYLINQCGVQDDEAGRKEIDAFIKNWLINVKLKNFLSVSNVSKTASIIKSLSPIFLVNFLRGAYRKISAKAVVSKASAFGRIDNANEEYKKTFQKEVNDIRDTLKSKELRKFLENTFQSSAELLKELEGL